MASSDALFLQPEDGLFQISVDQLDNQQAVQPAQLQDMITHLPALFNHPYVYASHLHARIGPGPDSPKTYHVNIQGPEGFTNRFTLPSKVSKPRGSEEEVTMQDVEEVAKSPKESELDVDRIIRQHYQEEQPGAPELPTHPVARKQSVWQYLFGLLKGSPSQQ